MSSISSTNSKNEIKELLIPKESSEEDSEEKVRSFSKNQLEEIARYFGIKDTTGSLQNLQDRCVTKIVEICQKENWKKINSVKNLIHGITDSKGNSLYDILTGEEKGLPNFYLNPPENLVFQGGGPKGAAYGGVLKELEQQKMLSNVKRVAGTSAGAITATFIAMGYSAAEVHKLIMEKPLKEFVDFGPTGNGGICRGEAFLKWMNKIIEDKTKIKNCTFGELRKKIEEEESKSLKERKFKHLHIYAIKVGANKAAYQFNSEDEKWNDLVIADAMRASMSLPVVFPAHTLHDKDSKTGLRVRRPGSGVYMDGGISGILFNFPIDAFDKRKFIIEGLPKKAGNFEITNTKTLGFSLYTPGEKIKKKG